MKAVFLLLVIQTVTCASIVKQDVSKPKSGLSVACQGPRSIEQMTKSTEMVSEAIVVDVSPARDNVYAVTLQVSLSKLRG